MLHTIQIIAAGFFVLSGLFFFTTATVGLLRFPDFYCRLHATGKGDTLGTLLMIVGFMIYEGFHLLSIKLILIPLFLFMASPTVTHSIGRAGVSCGVEPWEKKETEKTEDSS
jgi:multicomponent Na+:H+ antiporter subunit G